MSDRPLSGFNSIRDLETYGKAALNCKKCCKGEAIVPGKPRLQFIESGKAKGIRNPWFRKKITVMLKR